MTEREGNLQSPTRHPLDWRNSEFYDDAAKIFADLVNNDTFVEFLTLPAYERID